MNFEKFYYGADEILVFVDEAGDKMLADPTNPIFVLAGCCVRGRDLDRVIRVPWLAVRKGVRGDENKPIHMRLLQRRWTQKKQGFVDNFLSSREVVRFSFAITDRTVFELGDFPTTPTLELAHQFILQMVAELISGAPSAGLALVFEEGPTTERLKRIWPSMKLEMDGAPVPVAWATLSKDSGEPALEVADYLAHTTAGFMRHGRDQACKFAGRYAAIFPPGSDSFAKGLELNEAVYQPASG